MGKAQRKAARRGPAPRQEAPPNPLPSTLADRPRLTKPRLTRNYRPLVGQDPVLKARYQVMVNYPNIQLEDTHDTWYVSRLEAQLKRFGLDVNSPEVWAQLEAALTPA